MGEYLCEVNRAPISELSGTCWLSRNDIELIKVGRCTNARLLVRGGGIVSGSGGGAVGRDMLLPGRREVGHVLGAKH